MKSIESVLLQNVTVTIGNYTCNRKLADITTFENLIIFNKVKKSNMVRKHFVPFQYALSLFFYKGWIQQGANLLKCELLTSKTVIWFTCFQMELELIHIAIFVY